MAEATSWFGQLDVGDPRWQRAEPLLDDLLAATGRPAGHDPLVVKLRMLARIPPVTVADPAAGRVLERTAAAIRAIVVAP